MIEQKTFEIHVTVAKTSGEFIEKFKSLCLNFVSHVKQNNLEFPNSKLFSCKPIVIELKSSCENQILHPQQPMCSMFVRSTEYQAVKYGKIFGKWCKAHGFTPIRNKVEARLDEINFDINLNEIQCPGVYFEFHQKIIIDEKSIEILLPQLEKHFPDGRLSRSSLTNNNHRIITLRILSGKKSEALARLQDLLNFLADKTKLTEKLERELSIFDSDVWLDNGWI